MRQLPGTVPGSHHFRPAGKPKRGSSIHPNHGLSAGFSCTPAQICRADGSSGLGLVCQLRCSDAAGRPIAAEAAPLDRLSLAAGIVIGAGGIVGGGVAPAVAGNIVQNYGLQYTLWIAPRGRRLGIMLALSLKDTAPRAAKAGEGSRLGSPGLALISRQLPPPSCGGGRGTFFRLRPEFPACDLGALRKRLKLRPDHIRVHSARADVDAKATVHCRHHVVTAD